MDLIEKIDIKLGCKMYFSVWRLCDDVILTIAM